MATSTTLRLGRITPWAKRSQASTAMLMVDTIGLVGLPHLGLFQTMAKLGFNTANLLKTATERALLIRFALPTTFLCRVVFLVHMASRALT